MTIERPKKKIVVKIKKPKKKVFMTLERPAEEQEQEQELDEEEKEMLEEVRKEIEKEKEEEENLMMTLREKAFKGQARTYDVKITNPESIAKQMENSAPIIEKNIITLLDHYGGLKVYISTIMEYKKEELVPSSIEGEMETKTTYSKKYFNSKAQSFIHSSDVGKNIEEMLKDFLVRSVRIEEKDSGYIFYSFLKMYVSVAEYKPLKAGTYLEVPSKLQNPMKGLINIINNDEECFRWCHIRHLNPQQKNPQRIKTSDKEYINKLNYSGITFPVDVPQIKKIEKQNQININLFAYESEIYPLHISKENYDNHMELLLICKGAKTHYVLIKDFNRLMFNKTKHKSKKNFCLHCLQCFSTEKILKDHKDICFVINGNQAVKMPNAKKNIVKFNNYYKEQAVPFVIYADFEALTKKISSCKPSDQRSYTQEYQKHVSCGYGYKLVCCYDDKFSKDIVIYRGKDNINKFLEDILGEVEYCKKIINKFFGKCVVMTGQNKKDYEMSKKCSICLEEYNENSKKVIRSNLVTGEYINSAHEECRNKINITSSNFKIPVIFHNLKGYDSHLIMQEIGKVANNHTYFDKKGNKQPLRINCIPSNMEKYMAFMLGKHLNFIDSFQFMNSSLENLVSNLQKESFKYTLEEFQKEKLELMTRKGVYPYDWMDSFEKFECSLPSKDKFFSKLYEEHISDEDYEHAQKVWKTFNMKNMGNYHDLYLKSDVLLLADVFENFRKTCLEYYKLDPCHYYTSPGLSWDALLKMTKVKLELITDIDMYQFIEKGTRGGISYIAKRYSKANNKYLKDYDSSLPSKYIIYLDANNLYGWAMTQYLPTGGFKWLTETECNSLQDSICSIREDSEKGLILEVDLEYPKELHNDHNDYPVAVNKVKIKKDMLSQYCREIATKHNKLIGTNEKLIPTLGNKEKYVLTYRNLQLYLELGLKLKKIHRALEFNQSPWMKEYIEFNTNKRRNAENSFEKEFFKLMNNSVFGKTMENVRKRVNVNLVTTGNKLTKLVSKPNFVRYKIFNRNLVGVHSKKQIVTLNKPIYVGMFILDLSKTLMYDFHYKYIKNNYRDKAKLLFTDTDSLTYEIETEDVYKDFWKDRDKFDNSGYLPSSPFYFSDNKKVIGKFKDETNGVPIMEFVGLKSKMYSYIYDNLKGNKTAKGVKKYIIKKTITHSNYKETLLNKTEARHLMNTIQSKKHQLNSYEINKVSLSCYDDKRYILSDGINSYSYGHYLTKRDCKL